MCSEKYVLEFTEFTLNGNVKIYILAKNDVI